MHSRIFMLRYDIKDLSESADSIHEEYELGDIIGADYVTKTDNFADDIDWFSNSYSIAVKFKADVGVIDKTNINKLIVALEKQRQEGIEKARKLLAKSNNNIDCSLVADAIYPKLSFWFEDFDNGLYPERELLSTIKFQKPEVIYITSSYNYHC